MMVPGNVEISETFSGCDVQEVVPMVKLFGIFFNEKINFIFCLG